jgi:hypothetical protein
MHPRLFLNYRPGCRSNSLRQLKLLQFRRTVEHWRSCRSTALWHNDDIAVICQQTCCTSDLERFRNLRSSMAAEQLGKSVV